MSLECLKLWSGVGGRASLLGRKVDANFAGEEDPGFGVVVVGGRSYIMQMARACRELITFRGFRISVSISSLPPCHFPTLCPSLSSPSTLIQPDTTPSPPSPTIHSDLHPYLRRSVTHPKTCPLLVPFAKKRTLVSNFTLILPEACSQDVDVFSSHFFFLFLFFVCLCVQLIIPAELTAAAFGF